ncbi:uncharacterized protein L201_006325 [Kwoniella dendrophila CBS 6074]|uniref:RNase III domain-containing protein n=1 Tax=Kwoniella dendrophila CBS 6074 TaxID=1295534 RepID=A0AAX4K0X5_9TREE
MHVNWTQHIIKRHTEVFRHLGISSTHIGESLLNTFITCLLHATDPTSKPGKATDLRSKLVNNEINAHISRHYDLLSKVNTARSLGGTFRESNKEAGEVHEAYIAGLFYSYIKNIQEQNQKRDQCKQPDLSDNHNDNQRLNLLSIAKNLNEDGLMDFQLYGQAFNQLSVFLKPLYEKLIHYLNNQFYYEKCIVDDEYHSNHNNDNETLISLSEGSKSELNTSTQKLRINQPIYKHEFIWPNHFLEYQRKGTQGKIWKSTCTIHLRNGRMITCSGVGDGAKGPADNVAAYLVLQEIKRNISNHENGNNPFKRTRYL